VIGFGKFCRGIEAKAKSHMNNLPAVYRWFISPQGFVLFLVLAFKASLFNKKVIQC